MADDAQTEQWDKTTKDFVERFTADAVDLARKLGLPDGFLVDLLKEDSDWAFCIKLHAVIEAALRKAIFEASFNNKWARPRDEARLQRFCSALSFDGRMSKLELAETFAIVPPQTAAQLRALNKIRNRYVHDVSMVKLSLREVAATIPEKGILDSAIRISLLDGSKDPAIRFYALIGGVMALWQIDFHSKPPPSLLSGLFDGVTSETDGDKDGSDQTK